MIEKMDDRLTRPPRIDKQADSLYSISRISLPIVRIRFVSQSSEPTENFRSSGLITFEMYDRGNSRRRKIIV